MYGSLCGEGRFHGLTPVANIWSPLPGFGRAEARSEGTNLDWGIAGGGGMR